MGLSECHDEMPCAIHDSWMILRSRIMEYLGRNTIADLAKALEHPDSRRRFVKTCG